MSKFGGRRSKSSRLKPLIVVVFDDTKTAPAYFKALREQLGRQVNLKLVPARDDGAEAEATIDLAVVEVPRDDPDAPTTVWALVDLEGKRDSQRISALRTRAKDGGVHLALSQPCFEVWVLLHFKKTGRPFDNCGEVVAEVKPAWDGAGLPPFPQKKAQADYSLIVDRIPAAIANAKSMSPGQEGCWTEVGTVVEAIRTLLANGGPAAGT